MPLAGLRHIVVSSFRFMAINKVKQSETKRDCVSFEELNMFSLKSLADVH